MSVLIVTSLGDIVVDLHTDLCPLTAKNFLKLCKCIPGIRSFIVYASGTSTGPRRTILSIYFGTPLVDPPSGVWISAMLLNFGVVLERVGANQCTTGIKYYNGCLFHTIQKDFTAQTGDPTGSGAGGDSIYKFLYGDQARFFGDEIRLELKHTKMGIIAMASAGEDLNASQFYITLRDDLDYLDGKHTVFGEVAEGLETLQRINEAYVDEKGRPYKNIRIKHTYILDDPFDDPAQLIELIPDVSPEGKPKDEERTGKEKTNRDTLNLYEMPSGTTGCGKHLECQHQKDIAINVKFRSLYQIGNLYKSVSPIYFLKVEEDVRLEDDWVPMDEQLGSSELEEVLRAKVAHSSAVVLESIGDIPDADIKPPDNVLFVCKLNPVTEDEDLHTIFSRFGTVTSADVIRDFKTGDSLCYAFIGKISAPFILDSPP
ncbi:cyclophilin 59 [Actinidia rufa]|uniref:Peptidyl-prolyl cis-trans isomerase n=1 Tax=Actinidia rufa TaxID=165716 RepID=A0A7J0E034_9ERIC|nr:cyclophilin 59 [Actinidia rufa]